MKYTRLYGFIFLVLIAGSAFAMEYVNTNSDDYFVNLLPNQDFELTFLTKDQGISFNVKDVFCELDCKNLRSEGPYYYMNLISDSEGKKSVKIMYEYDGVEYTDNKVVNISYDLLRIETILPTTHNYLDSSNVRFIVTNNSDSDLSFKIKSNVPLSSFDTKDVFVKAKERIVLDSVFTPERKGSQNIEFTYVFDNYKKQFYSKNIYVDYSLRNLFQESINSYLLISPQLNLFSSIRAIFSFFA